VRALGAGAVEGRAPWPRLVLELLAAFDRPGAARALGLALLRRRPDEGRAWLARAARRGDARAAFALALSLRSGDDGPRRPAEAIPWLAQAAGARLGAAHFLLGTAYRDGDGAAIDQARALAHFEAAAELEDAPAIQTLAEAYRSGELGLPRDPERAEALRHELEDAAREPRWQLNDEALRPR
jgi:TPR repeat protein